MKSNMGYLVPSGDRVLYFLIPAALDALQRDKRQSKIAHALQDAIERCLVREIAAEYGVAVRPILDLQPLKPDGPLAG
jgi:hypothetical protein